MIVMVVDGNRRKNVKRLNIRVKQVDGSFVGICKHISASRGCRLDAVKKLDMRWLLEVEQVRVETQIMRGICSVDGSRDSSDYHYSS